MIENYKAYISYVVTVKQECLLHQTKYRHTDSDAEVTEPISLIPHRAFQKRKPFIARYLFSAHVVTIMRNTCTPPPPLEKWGAHPVNAAYGLYEEWLHSESLIPTHPPLSELTDMGDAWVVSFCVKKGHPSCGGIGKFLQWEVFVTQTDAISEIPFTRIKLYSIWQLCHILFNFGTYQFRHVTLKTWFYKRDKFRNFRKSLTCSVNREGVSKQEK